MGCERGERGDDGLEGAGGWESQPGPEGGRHALESPLANRSDDRASSHPPREGPRAPADRAETSDVQLNVVWLGPRLPADVGPEIATPAPYTPLTPPTNRELLLSVGDVSA